MPNLRFEHLRVEGRQKHAIDYLIICAQKLLALAGGQA